MNAFALLIAVVLIGIMVQTVITLIRKGSLELSRFWYLALGLSLMLPTMSSPLALMRDVWNPNPSAHSLNLQLTCAWALGLFLVIRFAMSKPRQDRVLEIMP